MKEEKHFSDNDNTDYSEEISPLTININLSLQRRIRLAASQNDLSIGEYLGRILEEAVPDEASMTTQDWHPVPPNILEEIDRVHEQVMRDSKGHIFEDSAEVLRREREART